MLQEKKRKGRASGMALDVLHIAVGILIVIFAVLAFLNPEENRILFPAIFLLASVLNLANGYDCFQRNRGKRKKRAAGTALMAVGVALFLLCVLSSLTIWWG